MKNQKPNGTVAFVSGANRGIGLETARGLGKLGITVLIGSRDRAKGEKASADLRRDGVNNVEAIEFEVLNVDHHRRPAKTLEERFGRLDILVNNAGIQRESGDFANGFNNASTVSEDVLRETFATNFFAVVALTQTLLPLIRRSLAGRIVNLICRASSVRSLCTRIRPRRYTIERMG